MIDQMLTLILLLPNVARYISEYKGTYAVYNFHELPCLKGMQTPACI